MNLFRMGIGNEDKMKETDSAEGSLKGIIDYDPVHFLRCHSRKNDTSDVQTQVSIIIQ